VYLFTMIAVIFIVILIFVFPFFFPGSYVTELLVSFLPYIAAICCVFVGITFVYFRKRMKPGYRFPAQRYFRGISFLVFCLLFFWYSKQFNHFYTPESLNAISQTGQATSLTILFANIHKDNIDYT